MWTKQCKSAFKLLKSALDEMPQLQYPNPRKPFKLFMDASKHSYSGILHQEEVSNQLKAEPNLVPIAYFSGSFSKTQQLWNTTQKKCYESKVFILSNGHKMHNVLQPQTTSSILHHWYVQPGA